MVDSLQSIAAEETCDTGGHPLSLLKSTARPCRARPRRVRLRARACFVERRAAAAAPAKKKKKKKTLEFKFQSLPVKMSLFASEFTVRVALRNLRLLQGMRPVAPGRRLRVAVCGLNSGEVAARVRGMEPSLDVAESGDGRGELGLGSLAGAKYDGLILAQPYHCLRDTHDLAGLHAALHPQDGSMGFIWARAFPLEGWMEAYTRGVASVAGGKGSSALPLLTSCEAGAPLQWVDDLNLPALGFDAPMHRKSIEAVEGEGRGPFHLEDKARDTLCLISPSQPPPFFSTSHCFRAPAGLLRVPAAASRCPPATERSVPATTRGAGGGYVWHKFYHPPACFSRQPGRSRGQRCKGKGRKEGAAAGRLATGKDRVVPGKNIRLPGEKKKRGALAR